MKLTPTLLTLLTLLTLHSTPHAAPTQPVHWGHELSRNQYSPASHLPETVDPSSNLNTRWIAKLGTESHSTPIAANHQVFIGTNNEIPRDPRHEGDRGALMAFNTSNGSFQWQILIPKYSSDIFTDWPRSGMSSTPTVEGNRIYMLSNRGEMLCLDALGLANGNDGPFTDEANLQTPTNASPLPLTSHEADVIWIFDIHKETGSYPHDAAHGSPLIVGDYLYINTGNGVDNTHLKIRSPKAPSLIVLNKHTGQLVAQDNELIGPRIFHSTWSSPACGNVNGADLIFFCGGDGVVYAFKPVPPNPPPNTVLSLEKIWWFDCDPSAPKENVHEFHQKNGKAKLSPTNIKSMPVFHQNRLYITCGGDRWWGKNEAWLKCINTTLQGDITQTGLLWTVPLEFHVMSSVAVQNGLAFTADCGRNLYCIDDNTGQVLWTLDTEGEVWATPLIADGKIYLGTRRGDFWILEAGREKKVLCKTRLDSPISATATVLNQTIYIATMEQLYAFALPDSQAEE